MHVCEALVMGVSSAECLLVEAFNESLIDDGRGHSLGEFGGESGRVLVWGVVYFDGLGGFLLDMTD